MCRNTCASFDKPNTQNNLFGADYVVCVNTVYVRNLRKTTFPTMRSVHQGCQGGVSSKETDRRPVRKDGRRGKSGQNRGKTGERSDQTGGQHQSPQHGRPFCGWRGSGLGQSLRAWSMWRMWMPMASRAPGASRRRRNSRMDSLSLMAMCWIYSRFWAVSSMNSATALLMMG